MDIEFVRSRFIKHFDGKTGNIYASPGRINLIGEHTDYNGGFVFPGAVDTGIMAEVRPNGLNTVIAYSIDLKDKVEFKVDDPVGPKTTWARYIYGIVQEMRKLGVEVKGFNTAFAGDVPLGAGMSSSAALESCFAFALNDLFGDNKVSKWDLVLAGQATEHNYIGVNCGIMDQFASVFGQKGKLMRLDCRSREFEYFPFNPQGYKLVLLNSKVKHELKGSPYNDRRNSCENVVKALAAKFPEKKFETLRDAGVRIISIGDNIDYPTRDDWMLIQFKFLMNEMPVTDTSRKIKQMINNRQKNGQWICAVPYGYRLINTKDMVYEIDPPAAEIVREVFRLYNNGWGYKKIANHLTELGIPTPRANEIAQKEAEGRTTKLKAKTEWSIISVSSIIANDFYIGTLRQKKYTRRGINGKDVRVKDDEQIVIENAHDAIIDTKTFAYAQEQLKLRSKSNYRGEKKYATDYSGFLFCGDCGSPMFSMSRPDLAAAYTCGAYHRRGLKGCTSHHIRVDLLDGLLKDYLISVRDNCQHMIAELEQMIQSQPHREEELGRTVENIEVQIIDAKNQLKELYVGQKEEKKLLTMKGNHCLA